MLIISFLVILNNPESFTGAAIQIKFSFYASLRCKQLWKLYALTFSICIPCYRQAVLPTGYTNTHKHAELH